MKKIEFTEQILNQIQIDYNSGKSVQEIASSLSCSKKLIYKKLHDMNITLSGRRINLPYELLEKIKRDYQLENKTIKEIAEENNLSMKVVITRLKEMNVPLRKGGAKIKYTCNENYFDIIDTSEKAYWLGFIYADGCVSRNHGNHIFQLSLKASDYGHLKKFLKHIESNHLIYEGMSVSEKIGNFPYARFQFYSSPKLCKRLIELGATERKSLTLQFPSNDILPNKFLSHFIRGFYDGDGCISSTKRGTHSTPSDNIYVVTFTGTADMLVAIKRHLPLTREIEVKPHGDNVYELRINGQQQIKKVLEYLYTDAEVFLDRKKESFEEFLKYLKQVELYKNYVVLTREQAEIINLIFEKYLTLNTISNVKKFLNQNGYRTFRGNLFSQRGICNILRNKSYKGEVLVQGKLKNIVKTNVFDSVQNQLDRNRDDVVLRTRNMVQYMKNKKKHI